MQRSAPQYIVTSSLHWKLQADFQKIGAEKEKVQNVNKRIGQEFDCSKVNAACFLQHLTPTESVCSEAGGLAVSWPTAEERIF